MFLVAGWLNLITHTLLCSVTTQKLTLLYNGLHLVTNWSMLVIENGLNALVPSLFAITCALPLVNLVPFIAK
jgi:hypothetical protein